MSKERILRDYQNSIIYTEAMWNILSSKRKRAIELLEMFREFNPFAYGSIARGNVNKNSDIDIIITQQIPSFLIEFRLNNYGFKNYFREIIMATPKDSIKLYIHLSELESITLPLTKLTKSIEEFYNFGGKIDLNQLKNNIRVPGIDKRLVLIKPTLEGHDETSIIGNEHITAKEVGISIDTVNERISVLSKREKHGRTGVLIKHQLEINESTEEALKKLANKKSIVRKKLYQR